MPSPLETLAKILKLEREQQCQNKAVVGGLAKFSTTWFPQAVEQARQPKHVVLAHELSDLMQSYDNITNPFDRMKLVGYMLDRIIGREDVPENYQALLEEVTASFQPKSKPPRSKPSSDRTPKRNNNRRREKFDDDDTSALDSEFEIAPTKPSQTDLPEPPRLDRPPKPSKAPLSSDEMLEAETNLYGTVTDLKGVGASIAQSLAKLGIESKMDLLDYFPRRYDDYTRLSLIAYLEPEQITTLIGTVTRTEVRMGRNKRQDFFLMLSDDTGQIAVTFYGQKFLVRSIRKGDKLVLSGKITRYRDVLQMSNPEWEKLDSDNLHTIGIIPVYPLSEGVTARSLRRTMYKSIEQLTDQVPEYLPHAVLERAELAERSWSIKNIHFPEGDDHLKHARRRYLFDQLIGLQLAVLANRHDWQSVSGVALEVTDDFLEPFIDIVFPYELTRAQRRTVEDIRRDVTTNVPMNRLIQGDVGSGKTAVAVVAMAMAVANGQQAALMAPTSILAEQHYRGIYETLQNMPDREHPPVVALLTSALNKTERDSIYRGLADGSIDIVIGTHALIQEGVDFKNLAVAVIDEQHRFGVEQRGALRGKGTNPHLLVMTATPIPRTLSLTMYADLDLSIIDEKPPGRSPVQTRRLLPSEREKAYQFVEGQLDQNRQAFVIHPLVEASETVDARSAIEAYDELKLVFHRYRVCLLHGRMSATEKDEIMLAFANGEYDIMVTTSVAEVGVNIPNASIILIEGANRFGLAQLHQFRGRVGRGNHQSFCLLMPDNETPESEHRLKAMEDTDDGFRLAELDFELRGAGDLLGTRQSGNQQFKLGEFLTSDLVSLAQIEAKAIFAEDPNLTQDHHRLLAKKVAMWRGEGDMS